MHRGASRFRCSRSGFTLVEIIVALAIVAALVALLIPALSGVKKRGLKTRELSNIKNVGQAWMMYGNANNDATLPGFLELAVQAKPEMGVSRGWGVTYKLPNLESVPMTGDNLTGPWTWRLLTYLSFNHELIHQHLDEPNPDHPSLLSEGKSVAYEPAFGYNGFYVGGWWAMEQMNNIATPFQRYYDHCRMGGPKRALRIPTTIAQVSRASEMVTFCAATNYANLGTPRRLVDATPGMHMVMPPRMEQTERWRPSAGDAAGAVNILVPQTWAPLARYTKSIAVLSADGHVEQQGFNALHDMRKWISDADQPVYEHGPCGIGE